MVANGGQTRKRPGGDRKRADVALAKQREDEARDAQAYGMKMDGKVLRQIADHFGWASPSSARDAVKRHVERTPAPDVEEARAMSLQCLYRARSAIMNILCATDLQGNPVVLDADEVSKLSSALARIDVRIAAQTGTDVPKRAELTGANGGPIRFTDDEDVRLWMEAARDSLDRRLKVVND